MSDFSHRPGLTGRNVHSSEERTQCRPALQPEEFNLNNPGCNPEDKSRRPNDIQYNGATQAMMHIDMLLVTQWPSTQIQ